MKHVYSLAVILLSLIGFQSCIDEAGEGVPQPKSVVIEFSEYTVDLTDADAPSSFVFRWTDVGNATYKVELSDADNTVVRELANEVAAGELNVLAMEVPHAQIASLLDEAGYTEPGTYNIRIRVVATPVDATIPTALDEEGSVVSSDILVTR